jgi:hypothetical protein
LAVFVERDHLGDGLFLTLIAAQDELKFDTHTGVSPGLSGRGMIQAIVPELIYNPQHLPALVGLQPVALPPASRYARASSSAFASCRSAVSKPSVNHP